MSLEGITPLKRKKRKITKNTPEIARLANIIDHIARYCWHGIPALQGITPEPTREQIEDALLKRDTHPKEDIMDDFDKVIKETPWNDIVAAVKRFKFYNKEDWQIYVEYIQANAMHATAWGMPSSKQMVAEKLGVSPYRIRRIIELVPVRIAIGVSTGIDTNTGSVSFYVVE